MELTPERREKRLALAREVIQLIPLSNIELTYGAYFAVNRWDLRMICGDALFEKDIDLSIIVDKVLPICQACALGLMFLAMVKIYDNVPFGRYRDAIPSSRMIRVQFDDIAEHLSGLFDNEELRVIEAALEVTMEIALDRQFGEITEDMAQRLDDAVVFGKQYTTRASRLAAIMQRLIDNNGEVSFGVVVPV